MTDATTWRHGKGCGFVMGDGRKAVIRCSVCGSENYSLSVMNGVCCWCGHDENDTTPTERTSDERTGKGD